MGQTSSTEVKNSVLRNLDYQATTSLFNSLQQSVKSHILTNQNIEIEINGCLRGDIITDQNLTSIVDISSVAEVVDINNIGNEVRRDVTTDIQNAVDRTLDMFSFLRGSRRDVIQTDLNERISTYINNNLTNEVISEVILSSDNVQNNVIRITTGPNCHEGNLILNQSIQLQSIGRNVVNKIAESLIDNIDIESLNLQNVVDIKDLETNPISDVLNFGQDILSGAQKTMSSIIAIIIAVIIAVIALILLILIPGTVFKILILIGAIILIALVLGFMLFGSSIGNTSASYVGTKNNRYYNRF